VRRENKTSKLKKMKFRTEVNLENSEQKILLTDRVFSVGSCFAEMSEKLKTDKCKRFAILSELYLIHIH
jgi:predicted amidophosphoribosyltransferase